MNVYDVGFPELIVVLVVAILLFWGGNFGPPIQAIRDMFRGGPRPPSPPPSHPLPGDDSKILNRPATVRKPILHRPDNRLLLRDTIQHRHPHAQMLIHQLVRSVRHPFRQRHIGIIG
jgi:hypothetical protein